MMRTLLGGLLLALNPLLSGVVAAPLLLQSTTSTQNSGLYDAILPAYRADGGAPVRVVAVGTGQAIRNAQNCDADVLLVHAKAAELAFVEAGYGLARSDVMYNDFVVVGPRRNPAAIERTDNAVTGLQKIHAGESTFISRGDDSGTHKKEQALWQQADRNPREHSGDWYLETGTGMGATLNIAVESNAYTLTDRATWLRFGNKQDHTVLLEGDPDLFNQYGVIAINAARCPHTDADGAAHFIAWLTGARGQAAIADYRVNGQQLFFPNAE